LVGLLLVACGEVAEPDSTRVLATLPSLASAGDLPAVPTLVPSVTPTIPPTANTQPTITSTPVATPTPADTPAPANSPSPVDMPPPSATPLLINDMSLDAVVVLPNGVRQHIFQIAERGRALGRDPNAFARVGGSVAATQHFMGRFDTGPYDLGPYDYLQPTIDYYAGSFSRVGQSAMRGLNSWAVFDPAWSDPESCLPNEAVIDCEIRLHNPSVMIVVLGTNDIGKGEDFEANLHRLVAYLIEQGIVPVLATKSDRFEGPDDRNNTIIREVAAELQVPLWDYDKIADTLPGRGMGSDEVHLTLYDQYDYTVERAFEKGYGVYNLTALMMLHAIREEIAP
jgi:hypothetical protein